MPTSPLTPQLAALFSGLIEDASGLHFPPHDRDLLGSKIETRAAEAGFPALLDYYYRLRYDDPGGDELRALVNGLLVHETYFFRELPSLVELVDGFLAPLAAKRRVRVWSAACATGEEPYTLAMLLAARGLLDQVDILGTDLSEPAIERARTGKTTRQSLRDGHSEDLAARYLDPHSRGYTVVPSIRAAVTFRTANLLDDAAITALGTFDAIICRNVMIYFSDETVITVLGRLASALAPGGLLTVGVAESLLRFGTQMGCEERGGSFYYHARR